jgi:plastocyanin
VLVFLEGAAADPPRPWLRANPRISQSGRRFEPRVLPVTVGTEVEFPNDDTIFHNVFSLSKAAPFDLGVYEPGQTASVQMQRTGLVKVYCNIHPEMSASIVVLDNSWFALTEPSGAFVIPGVPDGVYTLRGWNDMGAEARAPLEVRGARMFEARLELRETRRTIAHTNKFGGPYTGKYR